MVSRYLLIASGVLVSMVSAAQTKNLDYFISTGMSNSPLLNDFRNQAEALRYDSLLYLAKYKPQVNGTSTNSYAPVIKGFGYDQAITNGASVNALVGVSKSFPNRRNIATQNEFFLLQRRSLDDTSKITEYDLKRNIILQYITAFGDQEQLAYNSQIKELLTREEVILKKLTDKNVYRQVDYLSFLVNLHQQEFTAKQAALQYKNDLALLNYLCGIGDTNMVKLDDPGITVTSYIPPEQSIFIRKFETDSLRLLNEKALIDINYRPTFAVSADAGFNSSLTYQPYKNFGTSFGFSVIVPIYDGRQRRLQYSKINVAERTRQGYKAFAVKQYRQQVAQLQQQLTATEEIISDISSQLKYIETLISVNGKLLEAGEVKMTDYILALNNYLTARNLVTQNKNSRLLLINQINYLNR